MKRARTLLLICALLLLTVVVASPAAAQAEFQCDDGSNVVITNGVEFGVNVRPGDYRATVIGLNGFDPVMAVIELATGANLCNDDEANAADYAAELPTTGVVGPSGLNAQMEFSNTGSDFLNLAILVGGLGGQSGEFILVFEGMQVTTADGIGDPFTINFSPNLVYSGVGINAYAISLTNDLDPLIAILDDNDEVLDIGSGPLYCDDASNADLCWGDAVSLANYGIAAGDRSFAGGNYDAMLAIPADLLDPTLEYDSAWINFIVSSYSSDNTPQSTGEYVFAIHTGIADAGATGTTSNQSPTSPTSPTGSQNVTTVAGAVAITCESTARDFPEGEEGQYLNVECPANCTSGSVWGTGIYTDDSAICTAGIHAGMLPASGGQMSVTIAGAQDEYAGSTANRITSQSWGAWTRSFIPGPVISDEPSSPASPTGSNTPTSPTGNTSGQTNVQAMTIAYGDSLTAQVGAAAGDVYVFDASARDVVTIEVNADDFDPLIVVTDSTGRELTRDDDSGPGFNALVSNLRIPSDGQFIILVTSFTGNIDVGAAYEISLSGG